MSATELSRCGRPPARPRSRAPSVSISVDRYYKADYRERCAVIEPIFRKHEGRPPRGKLHTLGAKEPAPLHPQQDAFQAVRRRLDPKGKFLNPHLRHCLGEA